MYSIVTDLWFKIYFILYQMILCELSLT